MSALSNDLENKLINATLRNTTYTSPASVFVALYSTNPTDADSGTEITGGGYVRQAVAFVAPTDGATSNTADISFPVATGSYSAAVTHFGIRDASTAGNLLYYGALTGGAVTISLNGQIKFLAGELDVSLA